jgi:hypothetical protein
MYFYPRAGDICVKKCPPMAITMTELHSKAAMAATVNTEAVEPVREDKFAYNSLSCWSPPATSLALNFSNSLKAANLSFVNIEDKIIALRSAKVRLETNTPYHTRLLTF